MQDNEHKDELSLLIVGAEETKLEEQNSYLEEARQIVELEQKREDLVGTKQDREQRKEYAQRIFQLLCYYLVIVAFFIFLSGTESTKFYLSDSVVITLLGTTTANVIALFAIVPKYLFHKPI